MIHAYVKPILERGVPRYAAACAYYATLSLFPGLVCLSAIAAGTGAERALEQALPVGAVEEYMPYVRANLTPAMLAAAAMLLLGFVSAGIRTVMRFITRRGGGIGRFLLSFALAPVAAAAFILLVLLEAFGESVLNKLGCGIYVRLAGAAAAFAMLWGFCALIFKGRKRLKAAAGTSAGIIAAGAVSARIIGSSVNYSQVYGSVLSVVALMVSFFVCFEILLLGAAISSGGY
ncbi:MAG: YihY/virulence factor BrkB family protein [Oscillospiraceae bacterium]|nr:YihY/virulence factor BrkB family protein [Oscillospiraceae bacterium]